MMTYKKKPQTKLNLELQYYNEIPVRLIDRSYHGKNAKRFRLYETNQNVWIPNKHLAKDGTILPDQKLDYIFNTPTARHKIKLAQQTTLVAEWHHEI